MRRIQTTERKDREGQDNSWGGKHIEKPPFFFNITQNNTGKEVKDETIRASLQIIIQGTESEIGLNLSVYNDIFQMKSISQVQRMKGDQFIKMKPSKIKNQCFTKIRWGSGWVAQLI